MAGLFDKFLNTSGREKYLNELGEKIHIIALLLIVVLKEDEDDGREMSIKYTVYSNADLKLDNNCVIGNKREKGGNDIQLKWKGINSIAIMIVNAILLFFK